MTVIISPFSRPLRNNQRNPKNYPWWTEAVGMLNGHGIHTIQVGLANEEHVGAKEFIKDLSVDKLKEVLDRADTWASIDNFFQHFASYYEKRGVVIFGASDPAIFGYPENVNVLKGREYLRPDQFGLWESCQFREDRFVAPEQVANAILNLLSVLQGGNVQHQV